MYTLCNGKDANVTASGRFVRGCHHPGFGLQYVFVNKMKGAEEDCGDQGISFLPILSDSLGGWHDEQKGR